MGGTQPIVHVHLVYVAYKIMVTHSVSSTTDFFVMGVVAYKIMVIYGERAYRQNNQTIKKIW